MVLQLLILVDVEKYCVVGSYSPWMLLLVDQACFRIFVGMGSRWQHFELPLRMMNNVCRNVLGDAVVVGAATKSPGTVSGAP